MFSAVFVTFLFNSVVPTWTWSVTQENTLRSALALDYSASIRPEATVTLRVTFQMASIEGINLKDQSFSFSGWWHLQWNDTRLTWYPNMTDYIRYLQYFKNDVWTPVIVVSNSMLDLSAIDEETIPLRVTYEGQVTWNPPGNLKVACDLDITYFPFDVQTCCIEVTCFGYSLIQMDVVTTSGILFNYYKENGDWSILYSTAVRGVYADHGLDFPKVTFCVTMQRRPSYYWLNLVIPVMLTSYIMCLVFLLPADSGEKMGFSLTCLLTYVVLLTLLSAGMPTSAMYTSILEVYIVIVLCMGSLAVFFSVLNLHIYHMQDDRNVPNWLDKATRYCMYLTRHHRDHGTHSLKVHPSSGPLDSKVLDCKEKESQNAPGFENGPVASEAPENSSASVGQCPTSFLLSEVKVAMTWKHIADVMDAVLFRVYLVILTSSTLVFMLVLEFGHR